VCVKENEKKKKAKANPKSNTKQLSFLVFHPCSSIPLFVCFFDF
jgi:hypothetical protein